jgi:hypothetical protein
VVERPPGVSRTAGEVERRETNENKAIRTMTRATAAPVAIQDLEARRGGPFLTGSRLDWGNFFDTDGPLSLGRPSRVATGDRGR